MLVNRCVNAINWPGLECVFSQGTASTEKPAVPFSDRAMGSVLNLFFFRNESAVI